jgi:VCBS repeat-containing protein
VIEVTANAATLDIARLVFGFTGHPVATITAVEGTTLVVGLNGESIPAAPGEALHPGEAVHVAPGGLLIIRLESGVAVAFGNDAYAVFDDSTGHAAISLQRGDFIVLPRGPGSGPVHDSIITPFGRVTAEAMIAGRSNESLGLELTLLNDVAGPQRVASTASGIDVFLDHRFSNVRIAPGAASGSAGDDLICDDDRLSLAARLNLMGGDCPVPSSTEDPAPLAAEAAEHGGDDGGVSEVSPGGDLAAFTADPAVLQLTPAFDLTPGPVAVPGLVPELAVSGTPSLIRGLRPIEEVLLFQPPDASFPTPAEPATLDNWDPGRRWKGVGEVDQALDRLERPFLSAGDIAPRDGQMLQLVATGPNPVQIESFLNLARGSLSDAKLTAVLGPVSPSVGAAAKAIDRISLQAGESIHFDVFFDAAGAANDYAVMTVTVGGESLVVPISSNAAVAPFGASGWQTVKYTAGADGNYAFGFAVLHDGPTDPADDNRARLYVDDVRRHDGAGFPAVELFEQQDEMGGVVSLSSKLPKLREAEVAVTDAVEGREVDLTSLLLDNFRDPDKFDRMFLDTVVSGGASGFRFTGDHRLFFSASDALGAGQRITQTIEYTVSGGFLGGRSEIARLTVTARGVNDAPEARDDVIAGDEDGSLAADLLADNGAGRDRDIDATDALRITAINGNAVSAGGAVLLASGASVTVHANGTVTYSAGAAFNGLAEGETGFDTFRYTISDGNGGSATATVTVSIAGRNDAPIAADDTLASSEDGVHVLSILRNDSDPDGSDRSRLRVAAINGVAVEAGATVTLTSGAMVSIADDGALSFRANGAFDGLALGETTTETFSYQIADRATGGLLSAPATVTLTITGANDAPIAHAGTASAIEDGGPQAVSVADLIDDIDSDDDAASLRIVAASAQSGASVSVAADASQGLHYDPGALFQSLAVGQTLQDHITYVIADRHGATATGSIVVTVAGVNDAPVAVDDSFDISENEALKIDVRANDTDPDQGDLVAVLRIAGQAAETGQAITLSSGAMVTLQADGTLLYDPGERFQSLRFGETAFDTFDYDITDGHGSGGEAQGRVTVRVSGANDAPVLAADTAAAIEDGPTVTIAVLANDRDPDDGDVMTITRINGQPVGIGQAVQLASGANVQLLAGGDLLYAPGAAFQSLGDGETAIDTFSYTVEDDHGVAVTSEVRVTVAGADDEIIITNDQYAVGEGQVLTVVPLQGVLANDRPASIAKPLSVIEVNGISLSAGQPITLASGALLTLNADGSFAYDDRGVFVGLGFGKQAFDGFTYRAGDGSGQVSTVEGQVLITVNGSNTPPEALDDFVATDADTAVLIMPAANDQDVDDSSDNLAISHINGQPLSAGAPVVLPSGAIVTVRSDGSVWYDPNGQAAGLADGAQVADAFAYDVVDPHGGRAQGTVNISIHGTSRSGAATTHELVESFERPLGLLVAGWSREPGMGGSPTAVSLVSGTITAAPQFAATHLDGAVLLRAEGSFAGDIAAFLGLGGSRLPDDSDGTSANTGSAVSTVLTVSRSDLDSDGALTLSFDWNFIAAESVQPHLTGNNDFAVFTVSGGETNRVLTLADARSTGFGPNGWRTSVYTITDDFFAPGQDQVRLTVGFAVLNDANPFLPSQLLIDNVRFNRPLGAQAELLSDQGAGGLATYRLRPLAVDDDSGSWMTSEAAALSVETADLLSNDRVSPGASRASLAVIALDHPPAGVTLTGGVLTYDPRGRLDYLADGEVGLDRISYIIADANGGTDVGDLLIRVTGLNDAPQLPLEMTADAIENGAPILVDVLPDAADFDVDSDDDNASLTLIDAQAASGATLSFSGAPGAGLIYAPDGVAAFESLGEGETATDTITFTIRDRHGATGQGRASVTVAGRNDAPVASGDSAATDQNSSVIIDALANDSDVDRNDRLRIAAINGTAVTLGSQIALASGAVIWVEADGTLRFDPNGRFASLAAGESRTETFTYTAADPHGGVSEAAVAVVIAGFNDAPEARLDSAAADADRVFSMMAADLLANDEDVDTGDVLTVIDLAGEGVSFDGTTLSFDPSDRYRSLGAGEAATHRIVYTIADQAGAQAEGELEVTVRGVNDAPQAAADAAETREDAPVTIDVLANDADPDAHDSLSIVGLDTKGTLGTVTLNPDGTINYDPAGGFDDLDPGQQALDTFSYTVADGHGGTSKGTVSVTVFGRNTAEQIINSFETPFGLTERINASATIVSAHTEIDRPTGATYTPTDSSMMARLEAFGSTAPALASYLGLTAMPRDVPQGSDDPTQGGDTSFPASGTAIKFAVNVRAGDELSFDWLFDASDALPENDYALFTVTDAGGTTAYELADVRDSGNFGLIGWRTSVFTAETDGLLTIGFAAVNDTNGLDHSVLLVDDLRVNRHLDTSYQVTERSDDGRLETLMAQG